MELALPGRGGHGEIGKAGRLGAGPEASSPLPSLLSKS